MQRSSKTTLLWVWLWVLAGIGLLAAAVWKSTQPTIQGAPIAEIRAVLPRELLTEPTPPDRAAEHRFQEVESIALRLDANEVLQVCELATKQTGVASGRDDGLRRRIHSIFQANPGILQRLRSLLKRGPLAYPQDRSTEAALDEFRVFAFTRLLTAGVLTYAHQDQFQASIDMLDLTTLLDDRLMASGGTTLSYETLLVAEAQAIATVASVVMTPGIPASSCRHILAALRPSPYPDEYLANAIRRDFDLIELPCLPDPKSERAMIALGIPARQRSEAISRMVGNYDAIETAKALGIATVVEIKNARRPISEFDESAHRMLARLEIPDRPNTTGKAGPLKALLDRAYVLKMNRIPNSLGRQCFLFGSHALSLFERISDGWRTTRDLVRISLAARIYRGDHGGRLPPTTDGFLPLLGAWPKDPYNGKPMVYRPDRAIAYSVGPGLVDTGGTIGDPRKLQVTGILLK